MSRPVVLGIDCALYYMDQDYRSTNATQLASTWANALSTGFTDGSSGSPWTLIETITEVTLNMTAATADVTTRASGGWRQNVSTLKDASVDFSILWQPDAAVFDDLLTAFLNQCAMSFLVLDGECVNAITNISSTQGGAVDSCGNYGDITGLWADFNITSFTRNEALEEAVMADVTIQPTVGLVTPEWVTFDYVASS